MSGEKMAFDEVEVQALKDLIEVAVELKKTGLLGMLKDFLSDTEDFMSSFANDRSTFRLVALLGALLEAARRLDGAQIASIKKTTEDASYCLLNSLAEVDPAKAEPKGMMGAMSALRDPDVQKGLGFLLALAKSVGGCLNKLEEK